MFTHGAHLATGATIVLAEDSADCVASNDWGTVVATLIAAIIAALASVWAAYKSSQTANVHSERERTDRAIDYCRQQLNELYGPLYMLRQTSRRLYDVLREQMKVDASQHDHWRLVDHIVDVRNGSELAKSSVERILAINAEIQSLLKSKWGLLQEYPPHDSFIQFMSHSALLQQAWDKGANQDADSRTPFPRGIDQDIETDISAIKTELATLSSS